MINTQTVRLALRSATTNCHERVDSLFSQAELTERDGYGRFLLAQAAAHLPAEAALAASEVASVLPDWPGRRRGALLRADLAAMALPVPAVDDRPAFTGAAAILGGVYVLEGSRLGGQVLRRRVPPQFPASFLAAADPTGWRRLLGILEERLTGEAELQQAIAAAVEMFALFERSARRHLRL